MFFLAGTACCWSDTYDPDPYDDNPPVVTVDFNYVVPNCTSIRPSNVQARNPKTTLSRMICQQESAVRVLLLDDQAAPAFGQNLWRMVIPLRR